MAKKYFISDLLNSEGLTGESVFVLGKRESRSTRSGKPYLHVTLRDRSGEIQGKVWSNNLGNVDESQPGDVVEVAFEVQEYKGRTDLILRSIKQVDEYNEEDLILSEERIDPTQLKQELSKRIDSIRDFHLRKLVDVFFDDKEIYELFTTMPAGMKIHHSYQHGLLHHTLEVVTILQSILSLYPDMNRDLAVSAALLHDIGKLRELESSGLGQTGRSTEGNLIGHLTMGVEMINERLPDDFPEDLRVELLHIIVSHHGKLELGSPVRPATREAMAVHFADYASHYMNIAHNAREEGLQQFEDGAEPFGRYNRYLETSMYFGDGVE